MPSLSPGRTESTSHSRERRLRRKHVSKSRSRSRSRRRNSKHSHKGGQSSPRARSKTNDIHARAITIKKEEPEDANMSQQKYTQIKREQNAFPPVKMEDKKVKIEDKKTDTKKKQ